MEAMIDLAGFRLSQERSRNQSQALNLAQQALLSTLKTRCAMDSALKVNQPVLYAKENVQEALHFPVLSVLMIHLPLHPIMELK